MIDRKFLQTYLLPFIFLVGAVATLGSLYFSEVMKLPPCSLCWYQRIFMYPIPAVIAVGVFRKDKNSAYYALPLALIGLLIATYHNLLYYEILPESIQPCTTGVSCTTVQLEWLGFITIPLLSLVGFFLITASLLSYLKLNHKKLD